MIINILFLAKYKY